MRAGKQSFRAESEAQGAYVTCPRPHDGEAQSCSGAAWSASTFRVVTRPQFQGSIHKTFSKGVQLTQRENTVCVLETKALIYFNCKTTKCFLSHFFAPITNLFHQQSENAPAYWGPHSTRKWCRPTRWVYTGCSTKVNKNTSVL